MSGNRFESIAQELLSSAGIVINGANPWDIQVHDKRFYQRVLSEAELGLGESYVEGWWDCTAIDEFITRIHLSKLEEKVRGNWKIIFHALKAKLFNLQTKARSLEVGKKHYDLGNDLFQAILDKRLVYSCGYWKDAANLDEAQEAKLELVCRKIDIKPGMTVLDLGCGFGGFAIYVAKKYKAKVVGINIAKKQIELANELGKGLPVEFRLQDYREVEGKFDRVVSLGFFEHVGYKNYRTHMKTVDRCLDENGIAFIQTIGGNTSKTRGDAWSNKYLFPSGMIPSTAQIGKAMEGIFVAEDWHNFGPDYDKTFMAWYQNFEKAWPELKKTHDERFYRIWRYYLLLCAGAFRSRYLQLWQIVMTRPGTEQPNVRIS